MKATLISNNPVLSPAFYLSNLLLTSFLLAEPSLFGETVGWHPTFGGDIGLGLNIHDQRLTEPRVATFDTNAPYSNTGSQSINVRFVQHTLEMSQSASLNANVSLSFGAFNGKVGFSYADSQTFSGNKLSFVFDCTRDYGNVTPAFQRFDPSFTNDVARLKQQGLSGVALHQAVTDLYGTHVVYGFQRASKVLVTYQFDYGSESVAHSMSVIVQGSYGGIIGDFNSFAQSQFQRTDTHTTLNCSFWSSDPTLTPSFPVATNLTTYDQFVAYAAQVQSYCASMSSTNAKTTGYLIEPLQSLPDYHSLVASIPTTTTNSVDPNLDLFNQTFSKLRGWEDLLSSWVLDARHMSWLNTSGQQQIGAILRDVTNYRKTMEQVARSYLDTGTPLVVPDDVINYFANLNRIQIPTFYTLGSGGYTCNASAGPYRVVIGYVYCGSKALTSDPPFGNVSEFENGNDVGTIAYTTYSASDFEQYLRSVYTYCAGINQIILDTFSSPLWATIKSQDQTNRFVFFYSGEPAPWVNNGIFSYVLRDAAGAIVDQVNMLSTRSAGALGAVAAASPTVNLAVGVQSLPSSPTAGRKAIYTIGVTNNGPGAAYGVQLALPLINTNLFEVVSVSGSQGQGAITNGSMVYEVGPLASGNSTAVRLQVVPLVSGSFTPGTQSSAAPGTGLSDPNVSDNTASLGAVAFAQPQLTMSKRGSQAELSWFSDTSRIVLEQTSSIGNPSWTPVSGSFATNGSQWEISISPTSPRMFFRLHGM
jgi:hypothetical protein